MNDKDIDTNDALGLDAREQRAIAALMAHPTFEAASRACGVHERTLRRWMADKSDFRDAYRLEVRALMSHVSGRVQQATTLAIDTLEAVMRDTTAAPAARVTAARSVLEHASRAAEQSEIIERIQALEQVTDVKTSGART